MTRALTAIGWVASTSILTALACGLAADVFYFDKDSAAAAGLFAALAFWTWRAALGRRTKDAA